MTEPSNEFSADALERLRNETFIAEVEFHRELPSTSDRGLELSVLEHLPLPYLILADEQTAGRGRGSNRWWSAPGALTFSLLVDAERMELPLERRPQLSLTAGLALCETVRGLLPGADVGLKWPNDVWLDAKKVCGILVEVSSHRPGTAVLGIGVNVNNSLVAPPEELRETATSLRDAAEQEFDRSEVLGRLLQHLAHSFGLLSRDDPRLLQRWQSFCVLSGRVVHVETGEQTLLGVCQGIDETGALLLRTEYGQQRCYGGVVTGIEHG